MKLREIIHNIREYDDEGSVFAEKINGEFSADSQAVVIEMADDELKEKTSEVAKRRCPGKSYFLEVFLIVEFIEDFAANHGGEGPSPEVASECLIHYAEHDAYPQKFFG